MVTQVLAIPMMALMIPIIVVPLAILTKTKMRRREWEHAERMRALELGEPLPVPTNQAWPALVAIAIGAFVPVGSFLIAWLAAVSTRNLSGPDAFMGPTVVSIVAVICGYRLGMKLMAAKEEAVAPETAARVNHRKHAMDPDALDVVSRRG